MTASVNYGDAARRHFEDATLLEREKRLPNADQLHGLAAECALKAIMVGCGAPTATSGEIDRPYREHVNVLWPEYLTFMNGRVASRYLGPIARAGEAFRDWKVDQRYASTSAIAPARVVEHGRAAQACMTALQRAAEDGKVAWTT